MKKMLLLSLTAAACADPADEDRLAADRAPPAAYENVLLIIADDVGVDQIPSYGIGTHTKATMAAVDNLAAQGTRMTQAWANPVCSPTRASIYTGTMPYEHGVGMPVAEGSPGLKTSSTTLAEVMTDRASAVLGKWHLGVVSATGAPLDATDHGFDEQQGTAGGEPQTSYYAWDRYEASTNSSTAETTYATFETVDDTVAWVTAQSGSPWFAVTAFNAGHWAQDGGGAHVYENPPISCYAYIPPMGDTDQNKYRRMLRCMDEEIDRLLSELDAAGELENTTVIFVGDNGTDSTPDGYYAAARRKGTTYNGGVHVPLIFADGYRLVHGTDDPDTTHYKVQSGKVRSWPVHVVDLFPTIAEIAGFSTSPSSWATSIKSRLASSMPTLANPHSYVYAESFTTVTGGGHKTMDTCKQVVREAGALVPITGRPQLKLVRITDATGVHDHVYATSDEHEDTELTGTYTSAEATLAAQLPHACNLVY